MATGRRNGITARELGLVLSAVALAVSSQLCMRAGAAALPKAALPELLLAAATEPYVVGGLVLSGLSSLVWLVVLSRIPLSIAYPFNALGFVVIAVAGILVGEHVGVARVAGAAVVAVGVYLVGTGGKPRAAEPPASIEEAA